jgi:hypothetical protein
VLTHVAALLHRIALQGTGLATAPTLVVVVAAVGMAVAVVMAVVMAVVAAGAAMAAAVAAVVAVGATATSASSLATGLHPALTDEPQEHAAGPLPFGRVSPALLLVTYCRDCNVCRQSSPVAG